MLTWNLVQSPIDADNAIPESLPTGQTICQSSSQDDGDACHKDSDELVDRVAQDNLHVELQYLSTFVELPDRLAKDEPKNTFPGMFISACQKVACRMCVWNNDSSSVPAQCNTCPQDEQTQAPRTFQSCHGTMHAPVMQWQIDRMQCRKA